MHKEMLLILCIRILRPPNNSIHYKFSNKPKLQACKLFKISPYSHKDFDKGVSAVCGLVFLNGNRTLIKISMTLSEEFWLKRAYLILSPLMLC